MFEVYKDKGNGRQRWRWRFHDKDREHGLLAKSEEPFTSIQNVEKSINVIQKKRFRVETWISDKVSLLFWRLRTRNGRTLAMSPHGYESITELNEHLKKFLKRSTKAKVKIS